MHLKNQSGEIIDKIPIGGSRGGVRDARPPWASKFFRFHAVFGKIWRVHAPPGGFTPPPQENPGSATDTSQYYESRSLSKL